MNKRLWVGRYLGIDLYLHWSFFALLAAYSLYFFFVESQSLTAVGQMLAMILSMFVCVTLHEYGHALAARIFGVGTRDITMLPIGGLARLERMPREPWQEIVVAVAGPAVNVLIVIAIAAGLFAFDAFGDMRFFPSDYWHTLLAVNVILVLFNMLPAFPMDGGRVLRAFLALLISYRNATFIASRIGMVLAVAIGLGGSYFSGSPVPLLVGAFVFWAAGMENRQVVVAESLKDVTVGEVMSTSFRTLPADTPIVNAVPMLAAEVQASWPVVDGNRFLGMIDFPTLTEALGSLFEAQPVVEIADTSVIPATPATPLTQIVASTASRAGDYLPVIDYDGDVIGLVDLGKLAQRIALKKANHRAPLPPAVSETHVETVIDKTHY